VAAWELDTAGEDRFVELLSPLFEAAPRYLARLAAARPFGSWEALFAAADELALGLPEDEAIELLDAHPRIGAPAGSVSALSFQEQGYDREVGAPDEARGEARTPEEAAVEAVEAERLRVQAALDRLNDAYEGRFGFRYVVYVAGRPRSAIVALMEEALGEPRDGEMRRGLVDVVAIGRDRAMKTGLRETFPDPPQEGGAGR
jgi:2-oxo-4-hydroxy-4-carboxy--5-ureidoimidazoline (OHCU) decarboxylase